MSECLWLSPSSGPLFFGLINWACVLFFAPHPFLSERSRSERKWWQLAEEEDFVFGFSPKFKSRASEACTAFKLDEDT
ncbi:hypothetical protein [Desulfobaculum bizertense]|uniref:hypothetical protein n=1 Tax=Desulfobaculum bizertense TaxID=376490 RepID=UPI00099A5AAA|nr:hypothetical protein [Desulfobaculum bizertense]